MKPFSLLVKPAGPDCNLGCEYCFYLGKRALYPGTPRHRMAAETLELLVKGYLATEQPQHSFGWQGGEPLLMGEDFFRAVTDLQQKHGRAGAEVANGLQTNGTLLTPGLAGHFARFNFLVGLSLDGPPELHDRFRRNPAGAGSYMDSMRAARLLRDAGTDFNILTLVSAANVREPEKVYAFLCANGFNWHQYIPCVEFGPDGNPLPWSVRGGEWGEFLCRIFDGWRRDPGQVSVRLFDAVLNMLVDGKRVLCTMERDCRQYFVVEHNGDVYPCDFFVEEEWKLGNIVGNGWPALLESPVYRDFGGRKAAWHGKCASCEFGGLCAGDCQKHRRAPGEVSWLCEGWKTFYAHALPGFKEMAQEVRASRRGATGTGKPGPNDPCPCGSGRKFKKCCMPRAAYGK